MKLKGDKLGEGAFRKVYNYLPDPTIVIKVAKGRGGIMHNVLEYNNWQDLEDYIPKWLAPVTYLSEDCRYLLQVKCEPVYKLPKKLPYLFTDLKKDNFGLLHGSVVCVDYGYIQAKVKKKKVKREVWDI